MFWDFVLWVIEAFYAVSFFLKIAVPGIRWSLNNLEKPYSTIGVVVVIGGTILFMYMIVQLLAAYAIIAVLFGGLAFMNFCTW